MYALDWFVSTHKVWKYNYGGNNFKAVMFFEASFEPLFALASTADAIMTCLGTSAYWHYVFQEMKAAAEAAAEEGEEGDDAEEGADEDDAPAEEDDGGDEYGDEYGDEFRAILQQYGDEYGGEEEDAADEGEDDGADDEADDDAEDDDAGDSEKHPGDMLVWWDIGVHALDLGWSIWKAYDVYGTGIYHYDGGRYLGRMAGDTYSILDWVINRKDLTPYWNGAYDLYMEAAEARKAEKAAGGDDEGDDADDAEEEDAGEEEEAPEEGGDDYGDEAY